MPSGACKFFVMFVRPKGSFAHDFLVQPKFQADCDTDTRVPEPASLSSLKSQLNLRHCISILRLQNALSRAHRPGSSLALLTPR
jgi:hypothetical protein